MQTEFTPQPVCPHCGAEYRDAWEINFGDDAEGDNEITCGRCDEEYFVLRHVTVTYSTGKKP